MDFLHQSRGEAALTRECREMRPTIYMHARNHQVASQANGQIMGTMSMQARKYLIYQVAMPHSHASPQDATTVHLYSCLCRNCAGHPGLLRKINPFKK